MLPRFSFQRLISVSRKELLHILRDPMTLFFTLFVPIMEMFMLGYAIDTNVRNVRMVVLNQADSQESKDLIKAFENSGSFRITRDVAEVQMLVDGSETTVAATAVSVGDGIVLRESIKLEDVHVAFKPLILFNPDTRSANFFIPGLMVVMCQMMAVLLSATTIVREKENGTLEQLFMTPVRVVELLVGKLLPYLALTTIEFCTIAFFMVVVFQVPIHGYFLTLLGLFLPFVLAMLALGLWVSTKASTRDAAMQLSMGTVIPSIFLSGYVFPLDSMPVFFWYQAQLLPTTWMIDAARGVILRGAGWKELWLHATVLWGMGLVLLLISSLRFKKRL